MCLYRSADDAAENSEVTVGVINSSSQPSATEEVELEDISTASTQSQADPPVCSIFFVQLAYINQLRSFLFFLS